MFIAETRVPGREAGVVAEGELHAGLLHFADVAAVFEGCGEGLFVAGGIVPVQSCGFGGNVGVDVFAENVAVQEDALLLLFGVVLVFSIGHRIERWNSRCASASARSSRGSSPLGRPNGAVQPIYSTTAAGIAP